MALGPKEYDPDIYIINNNVTKKALYTFKKGCVGSWSQSLGLIYLE